MPAAWPRSYQTLDPEGVRKRGHEAYYDGGCRYGAFNAIVTPLAEKVGEPFNLVPSQMIASAAAAAPGGAPSAAR